MALGALGIFVSLSVAESKKAVLMLSQDDRRMLSMDRTQQARLGQILSRCRTIPSLRRLGT